MSVDRQLVSSSEKLITCSSSQKFKNIVRRISRWVFLFLLIFKLIESFFFLVFLVFLEYSEWASPRYTLYTPTELFRYFRASKSIDRVLLRLLKLRKRRSGYPTKLFNTRPAISQFHGLKIRRSANPDRHFHNFGASKSGARHPGAT